MSLRYQMSRETFEIAFFLKLETSQYKDRRKVYVDKSFLLQLLSVWYYFLLIIHIMSIKFTYQKVSFIIGLNRVLFFNYQIKFFSK